MHKCNIKIDFRDRCCGLDSSGLGQEQATDFMNTVMDLMIPQRPEISSLLSDYRLIKKDSAPRSELSNCWRSSTPRAGPYLVPISHIIIKTPEVMPDFMISMYCHE
jgi:hypothetical protein